MHGHMYETAMGRGKPVARAAMSGQLGTTRGQTRVACLKPVPSNTALQLLRQSGRETCHWCRHLALHLLLFASHDCVLHTQQAKPLAGTCVSVVGSKLVSSTGSAA